MDKKIKVLMISDHPMSPSGVGHQTLNICKALLDSGKFQIISLGGAIKQQSYEPQKTEEYGDDFIIHPVDGYGNAQIVRSMLHGYRPDIVWFMTDPRFYYWLWQIENEIRKFCPLVYYHVWDNYPYPIFNKPIYSSNDAIVTISKLTSDIVQTVTQNIEEHYIPHAINTDVFKSLDDDVIKTFKETNLPFAKDKFLFFWNSRNARRKQSGTLVWWFKKFLDDVGHDKATLLMHTEPKDENGQDLYALTNHLDLAKDKKVLLSNAKIPQEALALIYNAVDCTLSISDAEGFGLSTFESLACETPIIGTMTGGLQEQITFIDNLSESHILQRTENKDQVTKYEHGIGIEPASRSIIGSQQVPFIYEDRISETGFLHAMHMMYGLTKEERNKMGRAGRKHILKNYNFENFNKKWIDLLENIHNEHGSWDTRKKYKAWELREVIND